MHDDRHRFYPSRDPNDGLRHDRRRFLESAAISLGRPSLFYGSLRHPRVFEAVVGRPLDDCDWEHAAVSGLKTGLVNAGTGFPGVFADDEPGALNGIAVHDLTAFERTMIAWYEWDEYELRLIPLADGRDTQAFVPDLNAIRAEYGAFTIEPWSFDEWLGANLDGALVVAREWMSRRPRDRELIAAGFFDAGEAPAASRAKG